MTSAPQSILSDRQRPEISLGADRFGRPLIEITGGAFLNGCEFYPQALKELAAVLDEAAELNGQKRAEIVRSNSLVRSRNFRPMKGVKQLIEQHISRRQMAEALGVCEHTIRLWERRDMVRPVRINKRVIRYPMSEVQNLLESRMGGRRA